jgi:hypothetical protein
MMARAVRVTFFLAVLVVLALIAGGVMSRYGTVAAQSAQPFQQGKIYHLEYLGADFDVKVISAPSDGWATVDIVGGRWGTQGRVFLNTNLVATAKEVPAR